MGHRAVALLVAAVVIVPAAESAEEGAGAGSVEIARQLEGIRGELREIAKLVAAVERHQVASVLIARLELKHQRLASLEGELRSARDEREGTEQEAEQMAMIEESWAARKDDRVGEQPTEDERRGLEMMRQQKKRIESRLETLRLRIVELENDVARAREDVLALEETVDEQLGLR